VELVRNKVRDLLDKLVRRAEREVEEYGSMGLGHVAMAAVSAEARFGPLAMNAQAPDEGIMHTLHGSGGRRFAALVNKGDRMRRWLRTLGIGGTALFFVGSPAQAALEWATWVANDAATATGTFSDDLTVTFSGYIIGIDTSASNGTASPPIPGEASGGNPPGVTGLTGPGFVDPIETQSGDFVMAIDLGSITVDDQTIFAFSDQLGLWRYKLELLDGAQSPLPLGGVALTNYNMTYAGPVVADLNVTLSNPATGILLVDQFDHDAVPPGTYFQSGLVTLDHLPAGTRFIRLTNGSISTQISEGMHFYLAKDVVPEPASDAVALAALAALGLVGSGRGRRRGVRSHALPWTRARCARSLSRVGRRGNLRRCRA
jgi:hypothetical protein